MIVVLVVVGQVGKPKVTLARRMLRMRVCGDGMIIGLVIDFRL